MEEKCPKKECFEAGTKNRRCDHVMDGESGDDEGELIWL